jgi:hypothetical protein
MITFVASSLEAQVKFGAKAGLNISTLGYVAEQRINSIDMANPPSRILAGTVIGGYVYYDFPYPVIWLGVQAEILFSMQGGEGVNFWQNGENKPLDKLRQNYINVPLLVKYKFRKIPLSILLGTQVGFCVGRYVNGNSILLNKSRNTFFRNIDYALVVGVQYRWDEHLLFDIRYNMGLSPSILNDESMFIINKTIDPFYVYKSWGAMNMVLQLSVGWTF